MSNRKARLEFSLKRFLGFLKEMTRSKRGIVGIAIIIVAVGVAFAAPLITPYDPIYSTDLSGKLVPPFWAKYIPGYGSLTDSMVAVDESNLLTGANALKEFNITITPLNLTQDVIIQPSAFGPPGSYGSLSIAFKTTGLPINSNLTIQIMRDFYYPYSGIPGAVTTYGDILASRMDGVSISPRLVFMQKWLAFVSPSMVSYSTKEFEFGLNPRNAKFPGPIAYSERDFTGQSALGSYLSWQTPQGLKSLQASEDPKPLMQMFPRAGTYSYGISINVTKLTANAEGLIYVGNLKLNLQGSSFGWLGTDFQGRDVFTQLVYGTQVSLYVGLTSAILSTFIGLFVGLVAAYSGGIVDEVIMRFTDALLVLPTLPLMMVLILALSAGAYNINILILVFGFLGWQGFARMVRSQVLTLKERPYVEAAKAVGAGTPYILWRHILPNTIVLVYVTLALTVPAAIVTEAAFSFLGFLDLTRMSWGQMLTSLLSNPSIWWIVVPPGLAIMILSLSFILIGYSIDDILNPKLRARR